MTQSVHSLWHVWPLRLRKESAASSKICIHMRKPTTPARAGRHTNLRTSPHKPADGKVNAGRRLRAHETSALVASLHCARIAKKQRHTMRAVMSRRTQTPLPPTEVTPEHFSGPRVLPCWVPPPGCVNTGVHARMLVRMDWRAICGNPCSWQWHGSRLSAASTPSATARPSACKTL